VKGTAGDRIRERARPGRRYRRALVLFTAVFLLAGAAILWVAAREVERERLVIENERYGALRRSADAATERIAALIAARFESLKIIASDLNSAPSRRDLAARLLEQAEKAGGFGALFIISRDESAPLFSARSPFDSASPKNAPEANADPSAGTATRDAERLEFQAKDPGAAAAAYRKILAANPARSVHGRSLNGLARALSKSGQRDGALENYQRVRRDFGLETSEDGIPLGVLAAIEIGRLDREMGRPVPALDVWLLTYSEILGSRYALTEGQFEGFASRLDELIGSVLAEGAPASAGTDAAGRWSEFKRQSAEIRKRAQIAEMIQAHFAAPPDELSASSRPPLSPLLRSKAIDDALWIAGYIPLSGSRFLGALLDEGALRERMLPPVLSSLRADSGLEAQILDGFGRVLAGGPFQPPAAAPSLQRALPGPLSPWVLRLSEPSPVRSAPELRRKRTVYFAAAAIVLLAVFAGGWTTLRGVAKDVEVANLKSDFVATVSHELRTPVTGIRALSELLKEGRVPDDATRARYHETLFRESGRLSRMIENILDFSKIEAGLKEYRFASTDPAALTRAVASHFQDAAGSRGFRLAARIEEPLPRLDLDEEAISRALFNLLDNAAKYSGDAREIDLLARAESGSLVWAVRDRGPGIPAADLPRVFDKFYRSRKTLESTVPGSGIGLTLVKHIVQAHGGAVAIRSEEGAGTTVEIRIPVEKSNEPARA
jgi:signal transduction histidine kinase